jgi:phosphoheptose isomerase
MEVLSGSTRQDPVARHFVAHVRALEPFGDQLVTIRRWAATLAAELSAGRRLLVGGNGGSAAEAQHLTSELVGRYRSDRRPFDALSLHAESSAVTAIGNDYGFEEVFARQVRAHGRPADRLLVLSTSGRSRNLVRAVEDARVVGLSVWALTGPPPNPLSEGADEAVVVLSADPAVVQEFHLLAIHLLCEAIEDELDGSDHTVVRLERRSASGPAIA